MQGQKIKKTCVLLIFLTLASIDASAAEKLNVFEPVHWAYSSFFGTGWYNVDDARSIGQINGLLRLNFLTDPAN